MSNKNKGGREVRKPKATKNTKAKGQAPATGGTLDAVSQTGKTKK